MKRLVVVVLGTVVLVANGLSARQSETAFIRAAKDVQSVYTIAGNSATRAEARRVISIYHWSDVVGSQRAEAAFVVVKTITSRYPLNDSYDSLAELERDAESHTMSSGSYIHLSLFSVRNGRLERIAHMSYESEQ